MERGVSQKRKKFNITGLCIPQYHYMADVQDKVRRIIEEYVDRDEYFTINRARQYGKTTILYLVQEWRRLETVSRSCASVRGSR